MEAIHTPLTGKLNMINASNSFSALQLLDSKKALLLLLHEMCLYIAHSLLPTTKGCTYYLTLNQIVNLYLIRQFRKALRQNVNVTPMIVNENVC